MGKWTNLGGLGGLDMDLLLFAQEKTRCSG